MDSLKNFFRENVPVKKTQKTDVTSSAINNSLTIVYSCEHIIFTGSYKYFIYFLFLFKNINIYQKVLSVKQLPVQVYL
jgi:hypothetical protein